MLIISPFLLGIQVFIDLFGNIILVKLFSRELLIEYIAPVFYGIFLLA